MNAPYHFKTPWTDERVEALKTMWNEGLSASQCAERMGGITRNAVIGKISRLGLCRDESAIRETRALHNVTVRSKRPRKTAKPKPRTAPGLHVHPGNILRSLNSRKNDPGLPEKPPAIDYQFARPWIERKFGECAFPIGSGADLLSCCAPTEEGHSYCKACEGVVYTPQPITARRFAKYAAYVARRAA